MAALKRGVTWGKGLIKVLTSVERSRESNRLKSESQGSDKVVGYCLFGTSSELAVRHVTHSLSEPGAKDEKLVADFPE
jgi:hypothetical protein